MWEEVRQISDYGVYYMGGFPLDCLNFHSNEKERHWMVLSRVVMC